jgi:hypothetical protein
MDSNATIARRTVLATAGAAILRPAFGRTNTPPPPHVDVEIDGRALYQRIDGFGASARVFDDPHLFENFDPVTRRAATRLSPSQQAEILERLFGTLGLSRLRPVFDRGGLEPQNDNDDANVTDPSGFDFDWKNNDAQVQLAKQALSAGAKTIFPTSIGFERWMHHDIDPNEVAEWTLARLRRWRQLGVDLKFISLINEPGHPGSGLWSGEFIRELIRFLGPRSRAEGFETKFVVPDDVGPNEAYLRSRVILEDAEARRYVGALAYHLYSGGGPDRESMRELAVHYDLPVWMTEYSSAALGGDAIDWAILMNDLLVEHGVSAIDYMWGFFGDWEHGPTTLIKLRRQAQKYNGYQPTPAYYATGQFSRYVTPGMRRIATASSQREIKISAYTNGKFIVAIAINAGHASVNASFNFRHEQALAALPLRHILTDHTRRWADLGSVAIRGGTAELTLSARSVSTLILTSR